MPRFRFFLLDAADHIAIARYLDCETDSHAAARADRLLADADCPCVEVWEGDPDGLSRGEMNS